MSNTNVFFLDPKPFDYQLERTRELLALHRAEFTPDFCNAAKAACDIGAEFHLCHRETTMGTIYHVLQMRCPRSLVELMSTFGTYEVQ